MPNKKLYIEDELETFIELHNCGTKINEVYFIFTKIPRPTITERVKNAKEEVTILNTVPNTIITNEMEVDLHPWIISMQRNEVPVSRDMIIMKGNEIYCSMYGMSRSIGFLG